MSTSMSRSLALDTVRPGMGVPPAVVLVDTKYGHNAAGALRTCHAFGISQLWITGERWAEGWEKRMPREERMRRYGDVEVFRSDDPLRAFGQGVTPVAVEVMPVAEIMPFFEWPENPVFVFGPEDGSLPDWARRNSHRHVIIPTRVCLNLSTAIAITLYDWQSKENVSGRRLVRPSWDTTDDQRGFWDGDEQLGWTA